MEILTRQTKASTPKSPYNIALGYFLGRGKMQLNGHEALPYNFADATLADSMRSLISRVRKLDPSLRREIELDINDTASGLTIVLTNDARARGVEFKAEPSIDNRVLRYEGNVHIVDEDFRDSITLVPNSKAAYRGIARKSAKNWFSHLTGLPAEPRY
jgi:hypothetical protein